MEKDVEEEIDNGSPLSIRSILFNVKLVPKIN